MVRELLLLLVLLSLPASAYAYLDPLTGSIIYQAVAAAIVAILIFFKRVKRHIKAFFSKEKKEAASVKSDEPKDDS